MAIEKKRTRITLTLIGPIIYPPSGKNYIQKLEKRSQWRVHKIYPRS